MVCSLGSSCRCKRFLCQRRTKYHFPLHTFFHFSSPHRPATWVGSRAGSPASVSLSKATSRSTADGPAHRLQSTVVDCRWTLFSCVSSVMMLVSAHLAEGGVHAHPLFILSTPSTRVTLAPSTISPAKLARVATCTIR